MPLLDTVRTAHVAGAGLVHAGHAQAQSLQLYSETGCSQVVTNHRRTGR